MRRRLQCFDSQASFIEASACSTVKPLRLQCCDQRIAQFSIVSTHCLTHRELNSQIRSLTKSYVHPQPHAEFQAAWLARRRFASHWDGFCCHNCHCWVLCVHHVARFWPLDPRRRRRLSSICWAVAATKLVRGILQPAKVLEQEQINAS